MSRQTLILRQVPAAELDEVQTIYLQAGAKVESARQDDGTFTLRVTIEVEEVT